MKSILNTYCLILITILLFSCNTVKQNSSGVNTKGEKIIDSLLNSAVKNSEIPGAVVYISRYGKELFHKAYGFRNIGENIPMAKSDIFRMASMTKGLTAVAVLQLCEKGLLSVDDDVSKYIPEFSDLKILTKVLPDSGFESVPCKGKITIRELLTHTSGIGYGFQDDNYNALVIKNNISEGFEDDDRTSLENIQRIARLPLLFKPGEKYLYGLSYDVLGVVIEQISGMRFDQYIKKNILDPLEMKESFFVIPENEQYRLVAPYQPATVGTGLEPTSYPDTKYPLIMTRRYFSGGADLCSTAEDYSRFLQMMLNKGIYNGKRVLGSEYVEMMLSKQTPFETGPSDQGFAAWVTNEKGAAEGPMPKGSYGFGGFWDTYGWVDPSNDFTAVLLLQMYPTNIHKIHEKFRTVTYRILNEIKPVI